MRQLFCGNAPFAISTRRESSRRTINPFVRVPSLLQLRLPVGRVTAANVLRDDRVHAVHGQRHLEWVRTA
jgi:hypothetical protein